MQVHKKSSGFTLLELMVVLSIAILILVVGVPSFKGTVDNQRMIGATNELVTSLNLAKSEAIKRVRYVSICKSDDGASCTGDGSSWNDGWIIFANATVANLGSIDAGDDVIRVYPAIRNGLTVTPNGAIDGFLSFRPTGTIGTSIANMTGTLTMCDERGASQARGVLLEASGQWHVSRDLAHDGDELSC
jgi:type IV fimbrial biogenesis protein FimT